MQIAHESLSPDLVVLHILYSSIVQWLADSNDMKIDYIATGTASITLRLRKCMTDVRITLPIALLLAVLVVYLFLIRYFVHLA